MWVCQEMPKSYLNNQSNPTQTRKSYMISREFKVSSIAAVALLAACGGGGGTVSVAPSTEPALAAAKGFLAKLDVLRSSAPTSSSAYLALSDGCYLADGRSKAYIAADFDADPLAVASRQFEIGSTHTAPQVVAERSSANADGSTRREIDIKYVINYKDGTKNETAEETLVSGSSSGAKLADASTCATPDSKTDWRLYGNRKVVQTSVTAGNERIERTALSTGLPLTPVMFYSKYILLGVSDPAKVATYATVTGPGLGRIPLGTPGPLTLLSPRVLRSDPELAGRPGNAVDLLDTDSFRLCSHGGTGSAPAYTANCAAGGGGGFTWGFSSISGATVDTVFANLNIKAGDVYTIKVYNDDGWKTVDGQVGKTPIATYTSTLAALPFTAAVLAGTGPETDLFARITSSSKTPAEIATAIRTKAAISTELTWKAPGPMPDGRALALSHNWSIELGQANSTGANWPGSGKTNYSYPGSLATSTTLNTPAPVAALVVPTYAETTLHYVNRNGNFLYSRYVYQQ